jgi:uncharacterized lipoprotein YajG
MVLIFIFSLGLPFLKTGIKVIHHFQPIKMKKLLFILSLGLFAACNGVSSSSTTTDSTTVVKTDSVKSGTDSTKMTMDSTKKTTDSTKK